MLERVMIISGESSGELYGAFLARELKKRNPGITISGVGGERMRSAGVELISGISSSFGATEALKTYGEIRKTFAQVLSSLASYTPKVLVLIDYPDFNMRVAKKAKRLGIKVLYYVSPQVWAWRRRRVRTLGRLIDRMAVILPFEEELYRRAGVPCEFVGHPILDEIREVVQDTGYGMRDIGTDGLRSKARKDLGLDPGRPAMAVMPGSRLHEIKKLLPLMVGTVQEMRKRYPGYQFLLPVAPNLSKNALSILHDRLRERAHCPISVVSGSIKTLLASDCALIASGTSTLQAALLRVPMAIVYKLSPLTFFLGKMIVKVRHISLVNILLDFLEEHGGCAPGARARELLQGDASEKNIVGELSRIIDDPSYRGGLTAQMERLDSLFSGRSASEQVAGIVEKLGGQGNV